MSDLDNSFQKLLGRQPTDVEVQKLYRVRDALELKNNDALWLVLMALQHYETSYERMPKAIETAAASVLLKVKATADSTMKASAESFKANMAQAVASVAEDVARNTSRKQMWQWSTGAVGVPFLTLGVVGLGRFYEGHGLWHYGGLSGWRRMRKQQRPGTIPHRAKLPITSPSLESLTGSQPVTARDGRSNMAPASPTRLPMALSMAGRSGRHEVLGARSKELLAPVCIGDTHGFIAS